MFLKIAIALIFALVFPSLARSQSIPVPDVDGWPMKKTVLDVKINDSAVAYIGFELEYQNPQNPNEFVVVIMRSIPAVVGRNDNIDPKSFGENIAEHYNRKEEEDLLKALYEERSDRIIYIKWWVRKDDFTGLPVQDGDAMVWFQTYTGDWIVDSGLKVAIEFITDLRVNGDEHNISVGRKYSVDGGLHVLKIYKGDVDQIMKKEEKK